MPELAEIESFRRLAQERALLRVIASVDAHDAWYLKDGLTAEAIEAALLGRTFTSSDRIGKLLLLPTSDDGPIVGLRFGMSGRLIVDGVLGVKELWYSSNRDEARWDRFGVGFEDGGQLILRDPRRLGGVQLDPPEDRLGPDALQIGLGQLRRALAHSDAPLKARLLDQAHIAGVGNLAADEALWRASLSPIRAAGSLTEAELRRLHHHLRRTLQDFLARGGSHTGDLMPARRPGGTCPKDGAPLRRETVGTRTTWWCPQHQH